MAINLNDVLRVAARMLYATEDLVNVFHFKYTTEEGGTTQGEILEDLLERLEQFYTIVRAYMPESQPFEDIKVDKVAYVSGVPRIIENIGIFPWPTLNSGAATGEGLPSGVAALLNFRTAVPSTMGKKYLGRIMESAWDSNGWTSAVMTNLASGIANLLEVDTMTNGNAFTTVLPSKAISAFTPIISGAANAIAAYQRRRKLGVGA